MRLDAKPGFDTLNPALPHWNKRILLISKNRPDILNLGCHVVYISTANPRTAAAADLVNANSLIHLARSIYLFLSCRRPTPASLFTFTTRRDGFCLPAWE